ncbi:MAG: T9SS type A sorting domain-containing protein [Flavobacteriales bacterium]|nr:T9SS type A sorting domain-containing protein [Flavobacteriales bacterium]
MITSSTYTRVKSKVDSLCILTVVFILIQFNASSTVFETTQNGAWANNSTWQNGTVPILSDSVIIHHDVFYSENLEFLEGGYLIIDSSATLCGKFDITFVCGSYFYNYGIVKARKLKLKDSWSYGKFHASESLQVIPCFVTSYIGAGTIGIEFECDGCSIPITLISVTDAENETPNGAIEVDIIDVMNENLSYTFSIDGINFQPENIFDGLATGSYSLYIKDENGCVLIRDFNINLIEKFIIEVFPNPFIDELNVKLYNYQNTNIRLFDAVGKLIYSDQVYGDKSYSLNLPSGLSKGIYFLDITYVNQRKTYKLVKD